MPTTTSVPTVTSLAITAIHSIMFIGRRPGLLQYVTSTTLPRIPEIVGMPEIPPPGHKSHKNHLTVKSEAWRRLETIYQIDPSDFAQQVVAWIMSNVQDIPFQYEDLHSAERLSLGTRNRDGPDQLNHPADTVDRLGAFLDFLPLNSAQRLFHILYPDTLQWRFQPNQSYDIDQKIFDYFLWTRTHLDDEEPQNALVVAYQPPWILTQADFEGFVRCSSLPPHITPGHAYPPEFQSRHRVWGKLWDTCVQHNSKWFVLTSWNIWAFGGFSDGWCSGVVSDIWHLDEHTPNVLECLTYWMASAMKCHGGYRRPKIPEPLNSLQTKINLPAQRTEVVKPADSESNWKGRSSNASTSAHLTSVSATLSHQGIEDYLATPVERETYIRDDFIRDWRETVMDIEDGWCQTRKNPTMHYTEVHTAQMHGDWLV